MDAKVNFLLAVLGGVIIISLAMSLRSCGTPPIPEYFNRKVTLEEAISRAEREEVPVFAFFTADWCGVCAKFKRGPLSSSSVQDWIAHNAQPVYVDVTKAQAGDLEAKVLLSRYRVSELPTVLMLQKGQEIGRISGNVPRRDLLNWLKRFAPAK